MNDFGFNDYNALFQRMYGPKPEKDKAGWLDPALTAAGAIAGTMLMPGAGTAAGASLGRAAGGAAHSAANGDASGAIQGAMGLPAFWQQFAPYIGTFAEGGMVPDPEQEQQGNPMSMLTPELIAQIQQHAQTLAGPAPTAPTATPLRQPSHPTLETLATLMPAILGSLPKPANPKNTKAIGAWAPFAGNALAAPALIAQSRRKAANAPIEDANAQAQSDYEARLKAYEDQKKAYGTALIQGAMRPQGSLASNELDRKMTREESERITGVPDWEGFTLRQYQARNKPNGTSATTDVPLTGDALLMEAQNYLRGLPLTSFGRDQKNRVRVLNVAAALRRGEQPNIALTRADYAADKKSLTEIRVNLDSVTAFEKTALKNADVFVRAMQGVPDTGSPALNKPIRDLANFAMGDAEMAAYNAARRTIIPEFARILSNPRLVGQLTDQSRKEVDDIISGNATLAQALQTLQVLRQDAQNRREAYQSQLNEIRGRLGAGQQPAATQPAGGGHSGGFQWPKSSLNPETSQTPSPERK